MFVGCGRFLWAPLTCSYLWRWSRLLFRKWLFPMGTPHLGGFLWYDSLEDTPTLTLHWPLTLSPFYLPVIHAIVSVSIVQQGTSSKLNCWLTGDSVQFYAFLMFKTMTTVWNQAEMPVNRWSSFEVAPNCFGSILFVCGIACFNFKDNRLSFLLFAKDECNKTVNASMMNII